MSGGKYDQHKKNKLPVGGDENYYFGFNDFVLEQFMGSGSDTTKIMVGVDGSESSLAALQRAKYLAGPLNAHIEAIGCWDFPRMYDGIFAMDVAGFKESAEQVLKEAVQHVFGSAIPPKVSITLLRGDPKSVLVEASQDADLLVVGRRGRSSIAGLLIGSVSSTCIARAKCPVLIVNLPEDGGKD